MPQFLQQMVLDFHEQMGQTIGDPKTPNVLVDQDLRMNILRSELKELDESLAANDVVGVADALADAIYCLQGCAITWGIDLASVLEEVHRSNMTKTKECTDAINASKMELGDKYVGGVLPKGPHFSPAQVKEVLEETAGEARANPESVYGEDDGWWRTPTVGLSPAFRSAVRALEEPPPIPRELLIKAAMKSIKEDFCETEDEILTRSTKTDAIPEPVVDEKTNPVKQPSGSYTKWGGFVFDCTCGRTHAVQATLGSRGGLAKEAKTECLCGKAFRLDFSSPNELPAITTTTIEELRKDTL